MDYFGVELQSFRDSEVIHFIKDIFKYMYITVLIKTYYHTMMRFSLFSLWHHKIYPEITDTSVDPIGQVVMVFHYIYKLVKPLCCQRKPYMFNRELV